MFRHILCSLLIAAVAVSLLGFAHASAVYQGRVMMTVESKITILDQNDEMMTLTVLPTAKITLDGRSAVLGELHAGDSVRITTEILNGLETAVAIDAKTRA